MTFDRAVGTQKYSQYTPKKVVLLAPERKGPQEGMSARLIFHFPADFALMRAAAAVMKLRWVLGVLPLRLSKAKPVLKVPWGGIDEGR